MAKEKAFEQVIEDGLRDEILPMNNPNCKDCNDCCSMGTMLTDEEYEKLKKFLRKNKYGKFLYQQGLTAIHRFLKQGTIYWVCPFSHNKLCKIYTMRPEICRQFHCDDAERSKEFRDTYPKNSHFIGELFQKEGFNPKYYNHKGAIK